MKRIILSTCLFATLSNAQNLQTTLNEVLNTNPTVIERLKNYNMYKEDVTIAKSDYYPKLNLNLGAGYESTTRTKTDGSYRQYQQDNSGNFGDIHNLGYHVFRNSLVYTHNLFRGFGTKYAIQEQKLRAVSAAYSYIEQVNAITNETVGAYLDYTKSKELLKTAQDNVEIDKKILDKVKKLYDSGLTTLSEVNKIESSLALAKANLVVQENNILDASYRFEKILGRHIAQDEMEKVDLNVTLPKTREEALQLAFANNPSLVVSNYNIKIAEATNNKTKSAFYPKVDLELSANYNKNLSAISGNDDSYKGMVYLSYNIFNGFADEAGKQKTISKIYQEHAIKEKLKRDLTEKINLAWAANEKLQSQLLHLKEYTNFSLETLKLYAKEYDLGRRSLLDLLTAQNDYINSKAQIISVEYSLLQSKFRVLDATSTLTQTIMGDTQSIYAKVELVKPEQPHQKDTLPVYLDSDKDSIVDKFDICNNSLLNDSQALNGCKDDLNTTMIKRYSWFIHNADKSYLFEKSSYDKEALKALESFINEVSFYGFNNLDITLVGNAFGADKTDKELEQMSQQEVEYVKALFVNKGAKEQNIHTQINSNKAPLYSGDDYRNTRVDIIVKKLK